MDARPIGVFDSGLGGLTALRELITLLPKENFIYFGDTGRVPYGGRSRQTIIQYAQQDVAFLRKFYPKAIVIACGTVSTTALEVLQQENELPIFGVVEPACRAAVNLTRSGKIGLIGTQASIRTGAYERTLAALRKDVTVSSQACPLFVPLVENGRCWPGDRVIEQVAEEYLAPLKQAGVDTLMLGCTHYPLLKDVIGAEMGPDVALVDVGAQCAHWVAQKLEEDGLLNGQQTPGTRHGYVSDDACDFERLANIFLGGDITLDVEHIDISSVDI